MRPNTIPIGTGVKAVWTGRRRGAMMWRREVRCLLTLHAKGSATFGHQRLEVQRLAWGRRTEARLQLGECASISTEDGEVARKTHRRPRIVPRRWRAPMTRQRDWSPPDALRAVPEKHHVNFLECRYRVEKAFQCLCRRLDAEQNPEGMAWSSSVVSGSINVKASTMRRRGPGRHHANAAAYAIHARNRVAHCALVSFDTAGVLHRVAAVLCHCLANDGFQVTQDRIDASARKGCAVSTWKMRGRARSRPTESADSGPVRVSNAALAPSRVIKQADEKQYKKGRSHRVAGLVTVRVASGPCTRRARGLLSEGLRMFHHERRFEGLGVYARRNAQRDRVP